MKFIKYVISMSLLVTLMSCARNETTPHVNADEGPDLLQGSKFNLQLGTGYMKRGQYKLAKEKFEKAIEQDPNNIEAYSTIALLMNMLHEDKAAEDYYLQALDLDTNNSWLHNSYGTFLCGVGRIDDAMAEFKIAYTDPFYDTAYLALSNAGSCLVKHGDYVRAEPLLRKALKKSPRISGAALAPAIPGAMCWIS